MRASWTGSAVLAISISFRTAASGSLNGLGSANFTGFVLGWDVLTACRIFDGASVNRARKLARRNTMASALNATFQRPSQHRYRPIPRKTLSHTKTNVTEKMSTPRRAGLAGDLSPLADHTPPHPTP